VPADDPSVTFMREREWIIDTAELTRRPDLYGTLSRPEWLAPYPAALLLVPLISNQALTGFVVLLQPGSAFRMTFEEIDLLRSSGRQVAAFIAQHAADQDLAEARQFEAFNRLTAFVMHDLKNLIAQQSLMVKNAARHKANPAFFEDAIATIDNSVARMQKLLQQLQSGETSGLRQRVRLGVAVAEAVDRCRGREPVPQVHGDDSEVAVVIDRERLVQVLAHLIRNAQDACRADGRVVVRLTAGSDAVQVVIADDGCGMDEDFVRTRLFRPFDTTKGSKGMGIGAYQARTFILESGGAVRVDSTPGQGTEFVITLPVARGTETAVPGVPGTVGYDQQPGHG
jgi:putative PEP-CTERM system histidine kinase